MYLQIAAICDSAYEYENRLCLLGTFDTIEADEFPFIKSACSYVFQMLWKKEEEGVRLINVQYVNEEGQKTLSDLEYTIKVEIPHGRNTVSTNCIINLQQLKFTKAGNYFAHIYIDNKKSGSVQLEVVRKEANAKRKKELKRGYL